MQRVYSAQDALTIDYLRQVLETSGIECIVRNQFLSGAAGGLPLNECWPELWIADAARYDESVRLIDAALAPPARELRDWTCPDCGERIERQFGGVGDAALPARTDCIMTTTRNSVARHTTLEHHGQPLLPRRAFIGRMLRYAAGASLIVVTALGAGMLGYHRLEGMSWLDSFLNAAMILGGMGPVNEVHSAAGKLFAGCYALFSGLIFLVVAGILFTPAVHRLLHRFHVDVQTGKDRN